LVAVADLDDRRRRQYAIDPRTDVGHHDVFARLDYRPHLAEPGWDVNFLGVRTRAKFFSLYEQLFDISGTRCVLGRPPPLNEDYFEWITLLEAAVDASRRFTMIELGAGWGRWLANAALAIRQLSGVPITLVGVEPEPKHFAWMKTHLADNGVKRGERKLVRAAATATDGHVWFHVGAAADWYGQAIAERSVPPPLRARVAALRHYVLRRFGRRDTRTLEVVPAVSLMTLLRSLERVDLLDVDVQGAEADALEPAVASIDSKVRRVYVGTHNREVEARLRAMFERLAWTPIYDFPGGRTNETPWGRMTFEDGVQTWLNPRI
jgi:FkbM family methyltransferase